MKAVSKAQQRAAGWALSVRRGEADEKDLRGPAREMYDSMDESELEALASTSHENLPENADDEDGTGS